MMHSRRLVLNLTGRPREGASPACRLDPVNDGNHQEIALPCFHLSEQVQQKTLWLERINLLISSQFQWTMLESDDDKQRWWRMCFNLVCVILPQYNELYYIVRSEARAAPLACEPKLFDNENAKGYGRHYWTQCMTKNYDYCKEFLM